MIVGVVKASLVDQTHDRFPAWRSSRETGCVDTWGCGVEDPVGFLFPCAVFRGIYLVRACGLKFHLAPQIGSRLTNGAGQIQPPMSVKELLVHYYSTWKRTRQYSLLKASVGRRGGSSMPIEGEDTDVL